MDKQKYGGIEDLLDLTDSDDSSSSSNPGIFEAHQPFVLELHDLVKDDPTAEAKENQLPEARAKKVHRKKKKGQPGVNQHPSSDTSSSVSESSVPPAPVDERAREEFYDAHGSYHGLTENQAAVAANPVAAAGLMQAHSEHVPDPKVVPEQTTLTGQGQTPQGTTRREPSTISKPATGPQ